MDTLDGCEASGKLTDLREGTRIHRYLILGLIGKGGMGAVYKAYDPELDRRIAIKVLTLVPIGNQTISVPQARLMREAQALARLSHPNVVSVFDVGTYNDSVYIAMEYIEGKTLRDWLAQGDRSLADILAVFLAAGRGLQSAHAQGIVHRDFKPENLIVGDNGQVKILDFGLARAAGFEEFEVTQKEPASLLESSSGEQLLSKPLTMIGTRLGTLAYMAPEHFQLEELDEKTDQFSYCISLFEALYEKRPHAGKTSGELSDNVSQGRVCFPKGRSVPTWIQQIVLRGLSVSKEERFTSMQQLLEELESDPEAAKALRRRRQAWMLAIVLAALLPFGLWFLLLKGDPVCSGAQKKLDAVWNKTVQDQIAHTFISTKLSYAKDSFDRVRKLFDKHFSRWTQTYTETCQATHVHREQSEKVMDLRMSCLNRLLLKANALAQIFIQADETVVKKAVQAVGSLSGLSRCKDVEAILSRIRPPPDEQTRRKAEAVRDELAVIEALDNAGQFNKALRQTEQVTARAEKIGYEPVLAEALYWLGWMQEKTANYPAAKNNLKKSALLADKTRHDEVRAKSLVGLLWVTGIRQTRLEEALNLNQWVEAAIARLDESDVIRSRWLNSLGGLYWSTGDYDQALQCFQKTLKLSEDILGPSHPDVSKILNNLGVVYYNKGEHEQVLRYLQRSLKIMTDALGHHHPNVAMSNNNLGVAYYNKGDYTQALEYYRRAMKIWEQTLGPDHPQLAMSLNNQGNIYCDIGELEKALDYHQRALKIREKTMGADNPDVAHSLINIALVKYLQREYTQAKEFYKRALTIWVESLGPQHQYVSWALSGLGWIALRNNKPAQAISHFKRVLSICAQDKCMNDKGDSFAGSYVGLALALWQTGKERVQAIALAKQGKAQLAHKTQTIYSRRMLQEVDDFLNRNDRRVSQISR